MDQKMKSRLTDANITTTEDLVQLAYWPWLLSPKQQHHITRGLSPLAEKVPPAGFWMPKVQLQTELGQLARLNIQ